LKNLLILFFLLCNISFASETIKIYSPYSPGHSATPALLKIIEQANRQQEIYKFVLEFKPGGNQIIAVKSIDQNSLAIIAPAYVENVMSGKLDEENFIPIYALGNACWAVITNKDFVNQKEFVVGGVGFGNAAHLTALEIANKYKFEVRYIVFRSNNDALINMVGNNGVEFVIDKYEAYESLKAKNPKIQMVAASCPVRLPQEPTIKTLKELGIDAPYIFNIIISSKEMPEFKRKDIASILSKVTDQIGANDIFKLSAMRPPQFDRIGVDDFYKNSIEQIKNLQLKYRKEIENSQKSK
jgi:tripartite-type tricarboxylate transporter receptor subunit TctC